jgi:uncharacterized SAM-binding protein YcdF (DUF218 family)
MKHRYKIIITSIIIVAILICLIQAGNFLVISESPKKVDIIIVLSGDRGERLEEGARLFKEGYADEMLISGGVIYNKVTIASLMKQHAIDLKIPVNKIIIEEKADSTYENASFCKEILLKNKYRSAIVVTSNYHMRRTKMIFNRVYKDTGISLTYCASLDKVYKPSKWWSNNKSIMMTISEYIKLIGYSLGKNI